MQMWRKKKQPLLDDGKTAKGLEQAVAYEAQTKADQKVVVQSDGYSVERSKRRRQEWVYRVLKDKWKPFTIQLKPSNSRMSVMIWDAFNEFKQSQLKYCEKNSDAPRDKVTAKIYL